MGMIVILTVWILLPKSREFLLEMFYDFPYIGSSPPLLDLLLDIYTFVVILVSFSSSFSLLCAYRKATDFCVLVL